MVSVAAFGTGKLGCRTLYIPPYIHFPISWGVNLLYKPPDHSYSYAFTFPPVSFRCSYCCISGSSLQFLSKKLLISYIFSSSIFLNDSAENLMVYILHYFPSHSVNSKKITNNGISTKTIQLELTNTILEQLQKCNDAIVNVN